MQKEPKISGIILAGGRGTRLHPITLEIPKPLLTVGRIPIVQHLVDLFRSHGISSIYVIVHKDDTSLFERWNKEYANEEVQLLIEEERLGTWGGIKKHLGHLSETFLVSNGDELKEIDVQKLIHTHREKKADVTLGTVEVPNPGDYGVVESADTGEITAFHYKPKEPPTNFIMAGIYVAEPSVLEIPGPSGSAEISFEEHILPVVLEKKTLYEARLEGKWNDCGTFERYEKAIYEWTGKARL